MQRFLPGLPRFSLRSLMIGPMAILLMAPRPSMAVDILKTVEKAQGRPSYGLTLVLEGPEDVRNAYGGEPGQSFRKFISLPSGRQRILRWSDFWDGKDNTIDPGQRVRIGWSEDGHVRRIMDFFWTDQKGQRNSPEAIPSVTTDWTFGPIQQACLATWRNASYPSLTTHDGAVKVANVVYDAFALGLPMESLTSDNEFLQRRFRPLGNRRPMVLLPGEEEVLTLPLSSKWKIVLLKHETTWSGKKNSDKVVDLLQFPCGQNQTD